MGLDYTSGCVNIRDVGEFVNLILDDKKLQEKKIYRGGSIDHVKNDMEIGEPGTIINLRNGEDYRRFTAEYLHFPMSNKIEKYDTSQLEVKKWLNQIVKTFENPELKYPILIHCLSGKDRTGIVVATLLLILGVDETVIKEEYLLSEGEVNEGLISLAMDGVKNLNDYFKRINLEIVKKNLSREIISNIIGH